MGLSHPVKSKVFERFGNENFKVGVCSMQGYRQTMEDAHSVMLSLKKHPNSSFFGIFDGHSGAGAAKWCSTNLYHYIDENEIINDENIKESCLKADKDLIDLIEKGHLLDGGGCTAVFTIAEKHENENKYKLTVANIGDSRCLLGRDSKDLVELTKDHKPDDEIEYERIKKAGGFVSEGRVNATLALSRAFGDQSYKGNKKLPPNEQQVIAYPDITFETLCPEDFLVICCDGIFECMTNESVISFISEKLKEYDDIAQVASLLIDESLRRGSNDNMSVMIIKCVNGIGYTREKEFVPGPVESIENPLFIKAYVQFAMDHGYTKDEATEMIKQNMTKPISYTTDDDDEQT